MHGGHKPSPLTSQARPQRRHAPGRLEDLRQRIGEGPWTRALAQVTGTDRELIGHLLTGSLG
jgi:hypothetical protein